MRAFNIAVIGIMAISLEAAAQDNYKPPAGYVPDAAQRLESPSPSGYRSTDKSKLILRSHT